MKSYEERKAEFKEHYTGIYNADHYFDYLEEVEKNEELYKDATYSSARNDELLRQANAASFNKHLRHRK